MFIQISQNEAIHALLDDENNDYSYPGAAAIVECLERWEEDEGRELALDVVAIRIEFTEYGSACQAAKAHCFIDSDEQRCLDFLSQHAEVLMLDSGGVVLSSFS